MKIKYFYSFALLLLVLISCVGSDFSSIPRTISEAKTDKLLFYIYKPNKKSVIVNSTEYIITEAFTSTKFNSKSDKTPNINGFYFIVKLRNSKTGKEFEYDFHDDIFEYINFYSKNGGIHSSNLSINYDNWSVRKKLDTIKIGFLDHTKMENTINFIKMR